MKDYGYTLKFPVQFVLRPQKKKFQDFRGYCGKIESGIFRIGDKIKILLSGFESKIREILIGNKRLNEAYSPMNICIKIEDNIDISRGDMIVKKNNLPEITQEFNAIVTWFSEFPLNEVKKVIIKHTTTESIAKILNINYEIHISTLKKRKGENFKNEQYRKS